MPRKALKIRCNEIEFGSGFDCNVVLQIASYVLYDLHYDLAACTHQLPIS